MKNKKILEYRVGSHLYGTNTETSDEDYSGIVLPTEEQIFGFEVLEEIDLSVHSKNAEGKNTSEAKDIKYYELRKFMKLAMENNPNIIEQLFVTPENILYQDEIGKYILSQKHLFPYKGLEKKFIGYAKSQQHKMLIKPQNYSELQITLAILFEYIGTDNLADLKNREWINNSKTYLIELKEYLSEKKAPVVFTDSYIKIGDLNIQKNIQIKQAILQIDRRIKLAGNRTELYTKYGFDTKFGSHLLRLLYEGIELLQTGELIFPLKQKDFLIDIKKGKYSVETILATVCELEEDFKLTYKNTKLPNKPRYNEIQTMCMNILKENFK